MFLSIHLGISRFRLIGAPVMCNYHYLPSPVPCAGPDCPACKAYADAPDKTTYPDINNRPRLRMFVNAIQFSGRNAFGENIEDGKFDTLVGVLQTEGEGFPCFERTDSWFNYYYSADYVDWLYHPKDFAPDRVAFLDKIDQDTDDTAKLVYADWLDDRDEHTLAAGLRQLHEINGLSPHEWGEPLSRFVALRNQTPEVNPFDVWNGLDYECDHVNDESTDFRSRYIGNFVPRSHRRVGTRDQIKEFKPYDLTVFTTPAAPAVVLKKMNAR